MQELKPRAETEGLGSDQILIVYLQAGMLALVGLLPGGPGRLPDSVFLRMLSNNAGPITNRPIG